MSFLRLVLVLLAASSAMAEQANAQQNSLQQDTLAQRTESGKAGARHHFLEANYRAGRKALQAHAPEQAERFLRRVFEVQATYAPSPSQQPVAYWLGRACDEQGASVEAVRKWEKGIEASPVPPRWPLAHAYLQRALETGTGLEAQAAAEAYRALLRRLGRRGLAPSQREMLVPLVVRVGLLLPASLRRQVITSDTWAEAIEEIQFTPSAGERLLAWWRSQDPLPATPANERLSEHLQRVSYALRHYGWAESPSDLDDRGETYVRFGSPYRMHVIRFDDTEFIREVVRFGVNVSRGDFPRNEIWSYEDIDRSGKYIFVERSDGHYQLTNSIGLLPRRLRRHFGNTERGQNHAYSALEALRYIYEELSLHYNNFGNLYSRVSSYLSRQESIQTTNELHRWKGSAPANANVMSIGEGAGARTIYSNPNLDLSFPNVLTAELIQQSRDQGRQWARLRAASMPRQYTRVARDKRPLPVYVRTARFMGENGTTRTEVYWSTPVEALKLPEKMQEELEQAGEQPGAYHLIDLTTVQNTRRYVKRAAKKKRYLFEQGSQKGFLQPRTVAVKGDTGLYHLALQWDQRPARITGSGRQRAVSLGPKTRTRTYLVDSLRALSADEGRLEMSDLKPMTVPDARLGAAEEITEAATPYPYEKIGAGQSLLLYFEVYHLAFGADDQTRYTVDYEVYRRTKRGGLRNLFRGDKEQRTSTQATYDGQSRKAKEYIVVDLQDVKAPEGGQLEVAVRVTDEQTGQTRQRTLRFELLPRAEQTPSQ